MSTHKTRFLLLALLLALGMAAPALAAEGVVLGTTPQGEMIVSLGANQGVALGATLALMYDGAEAGRLVITGVKANEATGDFFLKPGFEAKPTSAMKALLLGAAAAPAPQAAPPPSAPASAPPPARAAAPSKIVLAADTEIHLRLEQVLSSQNNRAGDKVRFSVLDAVKISGQTVIEKGAAAEGVVLEARPAKGWGKSGSLAFNATRVQALSGQWIDLSAQPTAQSKKWNAAKTIGGVALLGAAFGGGMKGKKVEFGVGTEAVVFVARNVTLSQKGQSGSGAGADGDCVDTCSAFEGDVFKKCIEKCTGGGGASYEGCTGAYCF